MPVCGHQQSQAKRRTNAQQTTEGQKVEAKERSRTALPRKKKTKPRPPHGNRRSEAAFSLPFEPLYYAILTSFTTLARASFRTGEVKPERWRVGRDATHATEVRKDEVASELSS